MNREKKIPVILLCDREIGATLFLRLSNLQQAREAHDTTHTTFCDYNSVVLLVPGMYDSHPWLRNYMDDLRCLRVHHFIAYKQPTKQELQKKNKRDKSKERKLNKKERREISKLLRGKKLTPQAREQIVRNYLKHKH